MTLETVKKLSLLCGTSGHEHAVRAAIISMIDGHCQYHTDALGNLIVFKRGRLRAEKKVMLAAHMDEVGVMVSGFTPDGFIKFTAVGGVDTRVLLGRAVVFENGVRGVVGMTPPHLLSSEERLSMPQAESLYIDIGVRGQEQAKELLTYGDTGVFDSGYIEFGDGKIKCKALDDRAGCAVMVDMICSQLKYDTYFAFTVQEEIGCRGAKTAAYSVEPDYAVVLETTTAADIPEVPEYRRVCALGSGAAVSFMDRLTVYDRRLYDRAFALAEENGIKVQPKSFVAGGNDAGSIHLSRGGVKTLTVNIPCRYLHSASCVVDKNDILSVRELAGALAEDFAGGEADA